jgi:hypothetical protein
MSRTDEKGHNGWANYATWRVALEIFDGYDPDGTPVTAEYCEEYADELLTIDGDGRNALAIDYARAFLSDVDWREIADHINADYDLTPEED